VFELPAPPHRHHHHRRRYHHHHHRPRVLSLIVDAVSTATNNPSSPIAIILPPPSLLHLTPSLPTIVVVAVVVRLLSHTHSLSIYHALSITLSFPAALARSAACPRARARSLSLYSIYDHHHAHCTAIVAELPTHHPVRMNVRYPAPSLDQSLAEMTRHDVSRIAARSLSHLALAHRSLSLADP